MPAGVPIPPPVAADSSGAIAEEDGMPKEDPSKLERAPGEENEEVRNNLVNPSLGITEFQLWKGGSVWSTPMSTFLPQLVSWQTFEAGRVAVCGSWLVVFFKNMN